MPVKLIFSRAANGVIGNNNTLPWRLPEDMAHFKRSTLGCPVIMGRKTWDSLPARFRPLPGRRNIVITRQANWQADGAERAGSLTEAIALCPPEATVWVTGGAEIYAQAMHLAHEAVVTEIEQDFEGDAYAPPFSADWVEASRERQVSQTGLGFSIVTYRRRDRA
ncbi:MAG: dihydrofolate reductase [Burkholderiaceae bacterium]|nr:dihydrofolate reductase [Burkholderiaceae bacterium]MDO9088786.1 dihydrofolate reductase [Burkholderiaceae bacterium]